MHKKRITREKIINAFLFCAFDKSAGATSLQDISQALEIKKASLYNHFEGREEMYFATLEYCRDCLANVKFVPENLFEEAKNSQADVFSIFERFVKSYIQVYESEPILQVYTFVHTEQYFNPVAAKIVDAELLRTEYDLSRLILASCSAKNATLSPVEIDFASKWYAVFLLGHIDSYIMHKKEIMRKNPECGTGSLFALPTDDKALSEIYNQSKSFLNMLFP